MDRVYVRNNIVRLSICVFTIVYLVLISSKSSYVYSEDGGLREFGVGKSNHTVVPAWLASIMLAILIYFALCLYSSGVRLVW